MDQSYQNNNNEYNNGGYNNNGYNNGGGYNNGNNGNKGPGAPGPGKGNDPKKQNIFLLALAASVQKKAAQLYDPFLEFMRNVPPISLIALLILWFGIGETSKVIIIVLASFFPMFLNMKKGLCSCDPKLLEVGRACHLSRLQCYVQIVLPYAALDILVGMRIGLGYGWRAIIGAEMIAAGSGLGYLILDAQQMSRSDKVIVGIAVIGVVGILCDRVFSLLSRVLTDGGVEDSWN